MYVTDQPPFLNAVVEIATALPPFSLLEALQSIESGLGRVRSEQRYGPRAVDLDILLYGNSTVHLQDGTLTIPHPRLHERPFVLVPLCDLDDTIQIPEPAGTTERCKPNPTGAIVTVRELLHRLHNVSGSCSSKDAGPPIRVSPLLHSSLGYLSWSGCPKLMGIVNATPDSFSDGGLFLSVDKAIRRVEQFLKYGFEIIDVGGQSTRPGAEPVAPYEELKRVVPVVEEIRRNFPQVVLSVDTFHSVVASEALDAGADIINDVSAGRFDECMAEVVKRRHCVWSLMHMRGDSQTMMSTAMHEYGEAGVVRSSAEELMVPLRESISLGIPRWDLLVDPGIGFAKTARQSLSILRELKEWKSMMGSFPCVIGVSRKSALCALVSRLGEEDAASRDFATAGAVVAAMSAGADVVRVHNPMIADTLRVAHSLMKKPSTPSMI